METVTRSTAIQFDTERKEVSKMLKDLRTPWKFRFYLFQRLPVAWFIGSKLKNVSLEKAEVTIPFGWRSQNPFRSIYFVAQASAAELPAGLLAYLTILASGRNVSILLLRFQAEYSKKATTLTTFSCDDHVAIKDSISLAIETGESQECTTLVTGKLASGEVVSVNKITFGFKLRS